jgi:hypothetical protein
MRGGINMQKFKKKIDVVSIVGFAGAALAFVATQISSWSQQKEMERTVEEKVNEALESINTYENEES